MHVSPNQIFQEPFVNPNTAALAAPKSETEAVVSNYVNGQFVKGVTKSESLSQNASCVSLKERFTAVTPLNCTVEPVLTSMVAADHNAFENLRKHLHSLSNPYLVERICKQLNAFISQAIDVSSEDSLMAAFRDPLPLETREFFRFFFSKLLFKIACNNQELGKTVAETSQQLKELTEHLIEQNSNQLKDFEGWSDFTLLFKTPSFLRLKDCEIKKFIQLVELKSPFHLREYVDQLDQTKALKKCKLENSIKESGYKHNLKTLLGQIAKHDKKRGALKCLDEPNEDRIRLHHLERTKLQFKELLSKLAQKPSLKDLLLENLVDNGLRSIDFDCLSKNNCELASAFEDLSKKYEDDLKVERSPEELLREAVLEVNYSELVFQESNSLIARTRAAPSVATRDETTTRRDGEEGRT